MILTYRNSHYSRPLELIIQRGLAEQLALCRIIPQFFLAILERSNEKLSEFWCFINEYVTRRSIEANCNAKRERASQLARRRNCSFEYYYKRKQRLAVTHGCNDQANTVGEYQCDTVQKFFALPCGAVDNMSYLCTSTRLYKKQE